MRPARDLRRSSSVRPRVARPSRPRPRRRRRRRPARPSCTRSRGRWPRGSSAAWSRNVSSEVPHEFHPSAADAAIRRTAAALPPTQSGVPVARLVAATAASSAAIRSAIVPKPRPNVSFSSRLCESPAPMVAMTCPGAIRSADATVVARDAGGRSDARKTSAPTVMRDVASATAPSNATPSRAGRRVPSAWVRNRWS